MTQFPQVWLCPDQVFDGKTLQTGMAVGVAGGAVVALERVDALPADAVKRRVSGVVTPGFVDLQVNGGGDAMLNHDQSQASMQTIAAAHRRFGTVALLPTLITDKPEKMDRATDGAIAAKGSDGIIGIHIEGPHISIPRRGAHAAEFIRPLDPRTITNVTRLRDAGVAVMLTLAPEAVAKGQIAALAAMGVVVSIGHSDADADAVKAALGEGARCFTHLYNAMSPMLNRSPGVTGAAINSTAHAGFICDGYHVADDMLALAIRARPVADRMFLVSDAMSTVGGSDHFTLYGEVVRLVEGRLVNADLSLAGAHTTMAQCLSRLIRVVGVAPQAALRMATSVPAELMGATDCAGLLGRRVQDVLVLGADWMPKGTLAEIV
jgi:N-acetylglucosamine-6-phosphate deacetylase